MTSICNCHDFNMVVIPFLLLFSGDSPFPGILFYWPIRQRNASWVPDKAPDAPVKDFQPIPALQEKSPNNDLTKEWGHRWKKNWKNKWETGREGEIRSLSTKHPQNAQMVNSPTTATMTSPACEVTSAVGDLVPGNPFPRELGPTTNGQRRYKKGDDLRPPQLKMPPPLVRRYSGWTWCWWHRFYRHKRSNLLVSK